MNSVLSPPATAARRLLIVVDDTCTAPTLCASVRASAAGERVDVLVVSPEHGATEPQWYVDEDAARAEATHRLRACVDCLAHEGIRVEGYLGDADPVHAVADALRVFAADEILLVTGPQRPSRWLRPSVVDRVRRTFAQPVRHVTMPDQRFSTSS